MIVNLPKHIKYTAVVYYLPNCTGENGLAVWNLSQMTKSIQLQCHITRGNQFDQEKETSDETLFVISVWNIIRLGQIRK